MSELNLLNTLLPAAVTALAIRVDSYFIGPYWSLSEVIAGMGGLDSDLFYSLVRNRFALARRFVFPIFASGIVAFVHPSGALTRGAAIGGLTALLLLWPIIFGGLPRGVAKNDWLLSPLYLSFIVGFISAGLVGASLAELFRQRFQAEGLALLKEIALPALVLIIARTAFSSSFDRIKEKAHRPHTTAPDE